MNTHVFESNTVEAFNLCGAQLAEKYKDCGEAAVELADGDLKVTVIIDSELRKTFAKRIGSNGDVLVVLSKGDDTRGVITTNGVSCNDEFGNTQELLDCFNGVMFDLLKNNSMD